VEIPRPTQPTRSQVRLSLKKLRGCQNHFGQKQMSLLLNSITNLQQFSELFFFTK